MPFPLIKLGYLAVRQLSKPLANAIKERAKTHPFFRNKILLPPAQLYNKIDTYFKRNLLGIGKGSAAKPLSEDAAVSIFADMLGEFFIYSTAVTMLLIEYKRQLNKDQIKEDLQNKRLVSLEYELKKAHGKLDLHSLWLESISAATKVPRPIQETSDVKQNNTMKEAVTEIPSKIKDSNSKAVLQVMKATNEPRK